MTRCPVDGCGKASANDGDCPDHGPMRPPSAPAPKRTRKAGKA